MTFALSVKLVQCVVIDYYCELPRISELLELLAKSRPFESL